MRQSVNGASRRSREMAPKDQDLGVARVEMSVLTFLSARVSYIYSGKSQ